MGIRKVEFTNGTGRPHVRLVELTDEAKLKGGFATASELIDSLAGRGEKKIKGKNNSKRQTGDRGVD